MLRSQKENLRLSPSFSSHTHGLRVNRCVCFVTMEHHFWKFVVDLFSKWDAFTTGLPQKTRLRSAPGDQSRRSGHFSFI